MSDQTKPNRDRKGADPQPDRERASTPIAFFITFRTYGTWLPGDARETVDDSHNEPNTPRIAANEGRMESAARRMTDERLDLTPAQREAVDRTIREVCRHCNWPLHELNVRMTHVHGVVTAGCPPESVMNRWKSWATRRLVEAGLVARGRKVWARHGSTIWLWTRRRFEGACTYVRECQDLPWHEVVVGKIRVRMDVEDWER
jgi:REP element-mobilizing transposase RayT